MKRFSLFATVFVLMLLPLFISGSLIVNPVFADAVSKSKQEVVKLRYKGATVIGYRTFLNVTNNGTDPRPIYDFHIWMAPGTSGWIALKPSCPSGWKVNSWTNSEVAWKTSSKPIVNGTSNAGFDIVTDKNTYTIGWMTTDKDNKVIDSGYYTVSP